jgi:hypothetical protein
MLATKFTSTLALIAGTFVLMLAIAPVGMCQTDPVQETQPESQDIPEEIVVYGKKNIVNLRYAIYTAEDNFFAAYNKFNSNDDFDVSCDKVFSIAAHRRLRICKANFLLDYERTFAMGWNPNLATIRRKEKILVEEMQKQISEHPELLEVFTELANAKRDYNSERQSRRERR